MRKRNLLILLISIFLFSTLAACGSDDEASETTEDNPEETETNEATEESEDTEDEGGVEVDKGLFNVEITLPEMFFEGEDIDVVIENAESEEGISDITQNEDGSVTYKMSKSKHREMMDEIEESINDAMDEMTSSEEFPSIQEVESSASFNEFTVIVDKEAYENGFDGFATVTFGFSGLMYQLFDGVAADDYNVTIEIEDASNGEVFNTIEYPEVLEEMEEAEESEE